MGRRASSSADTNTDTITDTSTMVPNNIAAGLTSNECCV